MDKVNFLSLDISSVAAGRLELDVPVASSCLELVAPGFVAQLLDGSGVETLDDTCKTLLTQVFTLGVASSLVFFWSTA